MMTLWIYPRNIYRIKKVNQFLHRTVKVVELLSKQILKIFFEYHYIQLSNKVEFSMLDIRNDPKKLTAFNSSDFDVVHFYFQLFDFLLVTLNARLNFTN